MESDTRDQAAWPAAPEYDWQSPKIVAQIPVQDLAAEPGFFFRSARWLVSQAVGSAGNN